MAIGAPIGDFCRIGDCCVCGKKYFKVKPRRDASWSDKAWYAEDKCPDCRAEAAKP